MFVRNIHERKRHIKTVFLPPKKQTQWEKYGPFCSCFSFTNHCFPNCTPLCWPVPAADRSTELHLFARQVMTPHRAEVVHLRFTITRHLATTIVHLQRKKWATDDDHWCVTRVPPNKTTHWSGFGCEHGAINTSSFETVNWQSYYNKAP